MTPRLLIREFVIAKRRREDESDRDMMFAWHIAALSRQKKLPSLKSLLISEKKRVQSVDEQRSILHVLAGQYGGRVRTAMTKDTHGR